MMFNVISQQMNTSSMHVLRNSDTQEEVEIEKKKIGQDSPLRLHNVIFIKQNYRYNRISYEEILYLKADGNYTCVYTTSKTYMIKYSLYSFISQFLTSDDFIRIHRSFAINIQHISSFNDTTMVIGETEMPIGPNYRDTFMKLFIK